MKPGLQGQIALVTGASRRQGIGAAICRALATNGADIFFTCWPSYDKTMPWGADDAGPTGLQDELRTLGVRCEFLEIDLSSPTAPAEVIEDMIARLGVPSILINNAAYSTSTNYKTLDAPGIDAHYAVNVRAALLLSVEFARRFQGTNNGRIINLTSGQGLGPMPDELAYAATKGAVEAFTVSLAAALAGRGITVNAVNPGPTDTGWMSEELKQALLPRFPQGQIGQPEDVARLVAFLASDQAQWITGQIIHSEGGFQRG